MMQAMSRNARCAAQHVGQSASMHAGQPAFGYPGYASAVGAFGVGR